MKTREQIIKDAYDYIVSTLIKQNRLIDIKELYGDGSRWSNDKEAFEKTYYAIEALLKSNNLI